MNFKKPGIIIPILILIALGLNLLLVNFETADADASITTLPKAIWYMFVTLSTVGYGDYFPITTGGKAIGYIYVFSSLGVLGFLFSSISNRIQTMLEEKKLGFKGTDFTKHILIIGWNEFSRMVADEISHTEQKLAIVTNQKDDVDLIYTQYGKKKFFVLFADLQNKEILDKVNTREASVVFVSLADDSEALLYVLDFKKRYPQPDIVVSLQKSQLKDTFRSAGVTYVIARNEIASKLVASYIFEPDVADINLDLLTTSRQETDFDMQEYCVNENNPFIGKNCHQVFHELKEQFDAILMAVSKGSGDQRRIITNPSKEVSVEKNDFLVLMCNGISKRKIKKAFAVSEGRNNF